VKPFLITARTATLCITFSAHARSSYDAARLTAALLGSQSYRISVEAGAR